MGVDFAALARDNDPTEQEEHQYCWRPLALRAELVRPGDTLVGKDGRLLYVAGVALPEPDENWAHRPDVTPKVVLTVHAGSASASWSVSPLKPVKILVPENERQALIELRSQLGAAVTGRTT